MIGHHDNEPNCLGRAHNLSRELLLEWCRDNSIVWENPVRENTTHYTVEYTCKTVLVVSYHALGCERTCISGSKSLVFICKGLLVLVYIEDAIKGIK